jgi:predicted HTH transcriptional regulator
MTEEDTSQTPSPTSDQPAPPEAAQEVPASATEQETQTAQVPVNEPLPSQPEPIPPAPASAPQAHPARDLLVKARATIQDRKHKKLEKILAEIEKYGKITNDEVEKLLHVSDATATRYLSELEKEGKIKQVGRTGKAVEYMKA